MNEELIRQAAIETLTIEAQSVEKLKAFIDKDFISIVSHIINSKGRVVVSGIGKSAIIANKIVATLNSTGTPAIFMHAADAIHGDLGIVQSDDTVICISKSGNTPEIKSLVPLIKSRCSKLIGMTGSTDSYLAINSHFILNTNVEKEACPNNLAPTSSSTAQMAMGDALAVTLLKMRGFTSSDFARLHPGGSLGKRLYLKTSDIYPNNNKPEVSPESNIKKILLEISSGRLGATVVTKEKKVIGIITDGDLRRMIEKYPSIENLKAQDIMTKNPRVIQKDILAAEAMEILRSHSINHLIITDEESHYKGIIHIQDLVKEGIV